MTNLNPIRIIVSNKDRKVSENDLLKLIIESFNGLLPQFVEKYIHNSLGIR